MTATWTAERVRSLRTRLGISQTSFALELRRVFPALRTDAVAVSRWENGHVLPGGAATYALDLIEQEARQPRSAMPDGSTGARPAI